MKTIIIIGTTSGIGHALAEKVLESCKVISISRTIPNLPVSTHMMYDVCSNEPLPVVDGVIDGLVYCPGSINLKPFKSLKQAFSARPGDKCTRRSKNDTTLPAK